MDAIKLGPACYQACAGRIVGVTTTRGSTLLTLRIVRMPEGEAVDAQRWIGAAVEVLVMKRDADQTA
jgi:hypothetical protein